MTIGELWRRVVHLVRGSAAADELREEMQLHVELRARANRAAGVSDAPMATRARRIGSSATRSRFASESRDAVGLRVGGAYAHAISGSPLRRLAQRPASPSP